jgi:polar amino acid transport system substrate-binding protein
MKKRTLVLALLVFAALLLSACAASAPASGRTITVAVENAYPPFNYIDEASGEYLGWDYDTLREICRRLECTPEFSQAAWDGIFPAMQAGEFDVLADGVTFTEERDEIVDFSVSYVTIGQVLLVPIDAEIADLDAFIADAEKLVGTQIQTTNEIVALETFPADRVLSFDEFGGAVAALLSGDLDAVVIDTITALGFISENEGQLAVGPALTSDEQLAFVFPPGSELVAEFDQALEDMKADGTLQELNDKWFNP